MLGVLRGGELQDDFELRDPALVGTARSFECRLWFACHVNLGSGAFP